MREKARKVLKFYLLGSLWLLLLVFAFFAVVFGPDILLAPTGLFPPRGEARLVGNEVRIPARLLQIQRNLIRAVLITEVESAQSDRLAVEHTIRNGYVYPYRGDQGKRYAIKWAMVARGREVAAREIFRNSPVKALRTFRAGFFLGASTGALPEEVLTAIRNGSCRLVVAFDEFGFVVYPIDVPPE